MPPSITSATNKPTCQKPLISKNTTLLDVAIITGNCGNCGHILVANHPSR